MQAPFCVVMRDFECSVSSGDSGEWEGVQEGTRKTCLHFLLSTCSAEEGWAEVTYECQVTQRTLSSSDFISVTQHLNVVREAPLASIPT